MTDSTDATKARKPKPAPREDTQDNMVDAVSKPPLDAQGRPMVEEIDLNEAEEAALDAAWAYLREKWAKEGKQ